MCVGFGGMENVVFFFFWVVGVIFYFLVKVS